MFLRGLVSSTMTVSSTTSLVFGLLLLENDTVCSIAHKHREDPERINIEVLEEWVAGRGKHPVTWQTLTQVLCDIELNTLAEEIEAIKS